MLLNSTSVLTKLVGSGQLRVIQYSGGIAGRALVLLTWPNGQEAKSLCSGVLLAWVETLARPLPNRVTLGKSLYQFGSQFAHL